MAVPQPGQIIGQVDNQGRVHLINQQPRTANAVFTPASYPPPQQGSLAGDPIAKYNNSFANALFHEHEHGVHTVSFESPFNIRSDSRSPPPPSVEDGLDGIAFAPANLPLDLSSPTTLEHRVLENNALNINVPSDDHSFHIPSYYPLPNPDTFELTDDDDDAEMAGSLGRFVEAQREDNGVHFEAGGSGALVEPQFASRQVVNQDFRLDFAHLDLVPDGSPNPNYVPTTRDRSSDLDAASRRSTPR